MLPMMMVALSSLRTPSALPASDVGSDGDCLAYRSSDTRVFSRVDSFVTNTSFPWEQQGRHALHATE